jgi:tRNA U34 5-methylaminomethyl-2-thiouridine-forming methyltransferase MnmC
VTAPAGYQLVRLANGQHAVFSEHYREQMHPGLGPAAEAEQVHLGQLKLCNRLQTQADFVIWDVGLGAAANAVAALRCTRDLAASIQLISFDESLEPLQFAMAHKGELEYLDGYHRALGDLLNQRRAELDDGRRKATWTVQVTDFPSFLADDRCAALPKPHAIFFDPFSPARNPAMWTLPVFTKLHGVLEARRPCALSTYSRSTMIRVSLLLGGFFVGRGRPSGLKEETTVAANDLGLLDEPLDRAWLQRARHSTSAEPLTAGDYRQSPLQEPTWERLCCHRQFT